MKMTRSNSGEWIQQCDRSTSKKGKPEPTTPADDSDDDNENEEEKDDDDDDDDDVDADTALSWWRAAGRRAKASSSSLQVDSAMCGVTALCTLQKVRFRKKRRISGADEPLSQRAPRLLPTSADPDKDDDDDDGCCCRC